MDRFRDYGAFLDERPEGLTQENLKEMLEEHGEDWVKGYLDALQVVAANLSDIIYPKKELGLAQTPHLVKKNLKLYWTHNHTLLLSILPKIEPLKQHQVDVHPDL